MKCAATIVLFAICVAGLGASRRQFFAHVQPKITPGFEGDMWGWWVSADEAVGTDLETSTWEDRVAAKVIRANSNYQGTLTNTAMGWNFDSGLDNTSTATNVVAVAAGTNQTVTIITYPRAVAAAPGASMIYGPWDLSDITQGNAATHGGLVWTSTATVTWGTAFTGGPTISTALALSNWVDMTFVQSNTVAYFYTNGILSTSFSRTPPSPDGYPWYLIGDDDLSVAKGYVNFLREIIIWSTNLTSLQVSNIHAYRLMRYGP